MSKFTVILALIALIALVSARPQVDVVEQDPGAVNVIGGDEQVNIVDNDDQVVVVESSDSIYDMPRRK